MADDQSRRDRLAAEAAIFQREENALFETLCALRSLYHLRRATVEEQKFWNHFWYAWERKNHTNAMRQAFADMAKDPYFPSVRYDINPNIFTFCNFERYVAHDTNRYYRIADAIWNLHSVDLTLPFSLLDSSLQNKGVDYPLSSDDTERMLSGLSDHETIRLVLTQKYIMKPPSPAVRDTSAESEGESSGCEVAADHSVKEENGQEFADDATKEGDVVEITSEELERRKRNAEALRLRVFERAAIREKKEAARREKYRKENERLRAEIERRRAEEECSRELDDNERFLKLHMKRMRNEPRYRWAYKDQKDKEFIELKAKVEEALKHVPPQPTDTERKRIKKTPKTEKPQPPQPMPQPQHEKPQPPQPMPQPQHEQPQPPQPMPQPQHEKPQPPQPMPQPQHEQPQPPQPMPQPQQPMPQPMPQPQHEEPQRPQPMPQPQHEEPQRPQPMPQPQHEEPQSPQPVPPQQQEEPLPIPAISEITSPLTVEPDPKMPEPEMPVLDTAEPEVPVSELPTPVAFEPEILEPNRQEEKMPESVAEEDKSEAVEAEHKMPEEKEAKQSKQNFFIRSIKRLFSKAFG